MLFQRIVTRWKIALCEDDQPFQGRITFKTRFLMNEACLAELIEKSFPVKEMLDVIIHLMYGPEGNS